MKSQCELNVHLVSFIFLLMGIFLVEENCLVQGMPLLEASNYLSLRGYKGPTPHLTSRRQFWNAIAALELPKENTKHLSSASPFIQSCFLPDFLQVCFYPLSHRSTFCFLYVDLLGNTSVTSIYLKELL